MDTSKVEVKDLKEKLTITNEDIKEVLEEAWKQSPWSDIEGFPVEWFANAILRKAQEK